MSTSLWSVRLPPDQVGLTITGQRHGGVSAAKGLVMGIIAGVPFQVTGTAVGAILLGWAGANQWITLPGSKSKPEQLPASDEVVDAEVRDIGSSEGSDQH